MKYSFLLPAYKSNFLEAALRSIQAQTFSDFEVLISDDCSPEPLYDIVCPFLSDARFSYRKNSINIGAEHLVTHWNQLLEKCSSPYLIIAGDDDLYEPTFLEEIDDLTTRFQGVNLLRSREDRIDQNGTLIDIENPFAVFEDHSSFVSNIFNYDHFHSVGQYVFKTDYIKSIGGFVDFPMAWFSDDATAILCSNNGTAHTSEVLFHFRDSGLNISSQKDDSRRMELKERAILSFYKWYLNVLNSSVNKQDIYKIARQKCQHYCCDMLMDIYQGLSYKGIFTACRTLPLFFWILVKNQIVRLIR